MEESSYTAYAPSQIEKAFYHSHSLALVGSLGDIHFVDDTNFMEGSLKVVEAKA